MRPVTPFQAHITRALGSAPAVSSFVPATPVHLRPCPRSPRRIRRRPRLLQNLRRPRPFLPTPDLSHGFFSSLFSREWLGSSEIARAWVSSLIPALKVLGLMPKRFGMLLLTIFSFVYPSKHPKEWIRVLRQFSFAILHPERISSPIRVDLL